MTTGAPGDAFCDDVGSSQSTLDHQGSALTNAFGNDAAPQDIACEHMFLSSMDEEDEDGDPCDVLQLFIGTDTDIQAHLPLPVYSELRTDSKFLSFDKNTMPPSDQVINEEAQVASEFACEPSISEENHAFMPEEGQTVCFNPEYDPSAISRQEATKRRQELTIRRMIKKAARHFSVAQSDFPATSSTSDSHASDIFDGFMHPNNILMTDSATSGGCSSESSRITQKSFAGLVVKERKFRNDAHKNVCLIACHLYFNVYKTWFYIPPWTDWHIHLLTNIVARAHDIIPLLRIVSFNRACR